MTETGLSLRNRAKIRAMGLPQSDKSNGLFAPYFFDVNWYAHMLPVALYK